MKRNQKTHRELAHTALATSWHHFTWPPPQHQATQHATGESEKISETFSYTNLDKEDGRTYLVSIGPPSKIGTISACFVFFWPMAEIYWNGPPTGQEFFPLPTRTLPTFWAWRIFILIIIFFVVAPTCLETEVPPCVYVSMFEAGAMSLRNGKSGNPGIWNPTNPNN